MKTWLKNKFLQQTCPYCFDQFKLQKAPFRCGNLACAGRAPDPELLAHWPKMAIGAQGRVLDPNKAKSGRITCNQCSRVTGDRICPICHMTLPSTFGQCENAIISVIGAKNAGKSHYIATLVEELRNRVGPALDFTLSPQDDFTIERFARDFRDPLYRQGRALDATRSGRTDANVQLPMVFNLQFGGKSLFGKRVIKRTVTLVFFDAAGEDLRSEATMETVNRYIYRSSGIILLLDPRQIPQVRCQLPDPPDPSEESIETRDILSRVANVVRKGQNLSPTQIIKTPIVAAFSKFDEIEALIDPTLNVLSSRSMKRQYDSAEATAINDEVESLLASWKQAGLVHDIKSWFSDVAFCGVSSLGCKKKSDGTIPRLAPRRVEDPFLWLMHGIGCFKDS